MSAPTLRELQQGMKVRIQPGAATGTSDLPLRPQRGTAGTERLAVYADGYVVRLEEALAEVYEAVRFVVGAARFREVARAYAARHPSHDYNLSLAGRHLPAFLTTHALTQRLPFLPDLATLEWRVAEAFHAFDRPPVRDAEIADWADDDWADALVVFQPSVALVRSAWPVLEIWEARTRPRDTVSVDVTNHPQDVLVFRRDDLHVRCEPLSEPQAVLLAALLAGKPLGAVCATLAEHFGDQTLPVTSWFAVWRRAGLIAACTRG